MLDRCLLTLSRFARQIEHQHLGITCAAQGELRAIADPQYVAGLQRLAAGRERTSCDMQVDAPVTVILNRRVGTP
jgi:hypothetical protein